MPSDFHRIKPLVLVNGYLLEVFQIGGTIAFSGELLHRLKYRKINHPLFLFQSKSNKIASTSHSMHNPA